MQMFLNSPLEIGEEQHVTQGTNTALINAVCQEVLKALKGQSGDSGSTAARPIPSAFVGNSMIASSFIQLSESTGMSWIVDTGASDHMSSYLPHFTTKRTLQRPVLVRLPYGHTKIVSIVGNIKICPGITLQNVLYVQDFKYNLLSISKLLEDNDFVALFTQKGFMVQDPTTKRIVADGNKESGLYKLQAAGFQHRHITGDTLLHTKEEEPLRIVNNVDCKDLLLMHTRLGHASLSKMSHLDDISSEVLSKFICDSCQMAKFHRVPFSVSNSRATTLFELIHADLWGPYRKPDTSGAHYFLTILDDNTQSTWVYLMQNKMQVPDQIRNFNLYVQNQFSTSIKTIRTDNGTEFFQENCGSIFKQYGIIHQRSVAGTPQQNGRVERKHRHLVETTRAIKIHASLLDKFWGSCILATTYIINRLPSSVLKWKSPFEILYGSKPDMSHLKTIGCLCYALNLKPRHDKFAAKGRRCILLGYSAGQKAYKLYDLDNHTIFVSRDVHFEENVFPFNQHVSAQQHPSPHILPQFIPICSDSDAYQDLEHLFPTQSPQSSITPIPPSPNATQEPIPISCIHNTPIIPDLQSDGPPHIPSNIISPIPSPLLRRTARIIKPPGWLQDFACSVSTSTSNTAPSNAMNPLLQHSNFNHLHPTYVASLCNVLSLKEPHTYTQASQDPRWVDAMNQEIAALEVNDTWEITDLPHDKKAISSKWVYKIKFKPEGTVERFKARFVVRGFD